MTAPIARTPEPPYWTVIFTSLRRPEDDEGYHAMARALEERASAQPGFLGLESARDERGFGLTVSYWRSLDDVGAWKREALHVVAQRAGRVRWYADYALRIARVERAYTLATSERTGL